MEQAAGPVRTRCYCPNTPHEADLIHLHSADSLPIEAGVAAAMALSNAGGVDGLSASELIGALLRHGAVSSWNLVDEQGDALPVNPRTVAERLTWTKGGVELANAALQRYVIDEQAPFGSRISQSPSEPSSPTGPTDLPTSAKTESSYTPPEPSESSSPASSDGEQ